MPLLSSADSVLLAGAPVDAIHLGASQVWTPGVGISFVGATESVVDAATTIPSAVPAGVQDGDVLVAFVGARGSNLSITPPAGWVEALPPQPRSTAGLLGVYVHVAASEPASYDFVIGATTPAGGQHVHIQAWRGVDPLTPVQAAVSEDHTSATNQVTPLGAASTTPQCVALFGIISAVSSGSQTYTWEAPATERSDASLGGSSITTASLALPVAGAIARQTADVSAAGTYASAVVVLQPA